jgi:hypothetical protein
MPYLLLFFGIIAMAAGVFVIGFGIPIRETPFGAALLTVGSIAITGSLILVGLAAAVRELQRVVQGLKARLPGVSRPLRPMERNDGEHKDGTDKRTAPPPPRLPMPGALGSEAPHALAAKFDAPDTPGLGRKPGPEWLRRAIAEIESAPRPADARLGGPDGDRADVRRSSADWSRAADPPSPDPYVPEVRQAPAVSPPNIFDMMRPSERRKTEGPPEQRTEASPETLIRSIEARLSPTAPASPNPAAPARPVRAEQRSLPILKSGVIDEMAYTLFTDGSIEAQVPGGTMRFASIDELRQHLEKHED